MKKLRLSLAILTLIASFSAFCDDMSGDWDAMGNPIARPAPQPQPIYPHPGA